MSTETLTKEKVPGGVQADINPYLSPQYKKRIEDGHGASYAAHMAQIHLPCHNFTRWQQEAYDAIMAGKKFIFLRPHGCGKTYLVDAVKEDLKIIAAAIEELDQ